MATKTYTFTDPEVVARRIGWANQSNPDRCCPQGSLFNFAAWFNGTDASVAAGAYGAQPFLVSVDGGATTAPTLSNGTIPLFAGLADGPHFVQFWGDLQYATTGSWLPTSGTLFTVTGANPSLGPGTDLGPALIVTDPQFAAYGLYYGGVIPNTGAAWSGGNDPNVTPAFALPGASQAGGGSPPNPTFADVNGAPANLCLGSAGFFAKAFALQVWTDATEVALGVDGGPLVRIALPGSGIRWVKVTSGLDVHSAHLYRIVAGSRYGSGTGQLLAVMVGGAGAAFVAKPYPLLPALHNGDSIAGAVGASAGDRHYFFQALQGTPYVGASVGYPGQTTPQILANWGKTTGLLPSAPKLCSLGTGRNDNAAMSGLAASMTALANDALTLVGSGGTVIAQLPLTTEQNTDAKSVLSAAVDTIADARLHKIDPGTCPTIETADGTHPDDAGNATVGYYLQPLYAAILVPAAPANSWPSAGQVQAGVTFVANGSSVTGTYDQVTGRYSDPGAAHVQAGTTYQFAGSTVTGTLATGSGGSGSPSAADIASAVWGASGRTLTGFSFNVALSASGLDQIPTTPPAPGAAPNFRQMLVMGWRRWFKKAVFDGSSLTGYADDNVTPLYSQPLTSTNSGASQGAAQ